MQNLSQDSEESDDESSAASEEEGDDDDDDEDDAEQQQLVSSLFSNIFHPFQSTITIARRRQIYSTQPRDLNYKKTKNQTTLKYQKWRQSAK